MLPTPFRWQDGHIELELGGAGVLFTTRRGGVSAGPYTSLNLGRWTDDAPEAVAENRARVEARAGARFAFARQVHGGAVVPADEPTAEPAEADGILTTARGVAPMVLTADCVPVALVADGVVGMLHGGWRGLAGGIVTRGVQQLRALARPGAHISAAIGPGAGPCCYEVAEDVHDAFRAFGPAVRRGRNLDLKAVARLQLAAAGVGEIHDCAQCTMCGADERFFSHRRDGGVTGRQAGVVWRR